MKSCTCLWIMPFMCKHKFEGLWMRIEIVWEGALPPHQHFLISPTFTSNLCLHNIIHALFAFFKWIFEVELMEFLVSMFKISAEQGKKLSEAQNLLWNRVANVRKSLQSIERVFRNNYTGVLSKFCSVFNRFCNTKKIYLFFRWVKKLYFFAKRCRLGQVWYYLLEYDGHCSQA